MAATLANGGKNPVTGKQVVKTDNVPEILAVMATAGLYDDSGKWLFAPASRKSGVGGGILAVSPGKFGIAVISPPLDAAGNSVKAQKPSRTSPTPWAATLCGETEVTLGFGGWGSSENILTTDVFHSSSSFLTSIPFFRLVRLQ